MVICKVDNPFADNPEITAYIYSESHRQQSTYIENNKNSALNTKLPVLSLLHCAFVSFISPSQKIK